MPCILYLDDLFMGLSAFSFVHFFTNLQQFLSIWFGSLSTYIVKHCSFHPFPSFRYKFHQSKESDSRIWEGFLRMFSVTV